MLMRADCSHMSFPMPALGVYLCESKSTARLHGSDHRPSPKMQRIYHRFATLLDIHRPADPPKDKDRGSVGSGGRENDIGRAVSGDRKAVGRDRDREGWSGGEGVWERKSADEIPTTNSGGSRTQVVKPQVQAEPFSGYVIEAPSSSTSGSGDDDFHGGTSSAISADVLQWLSSISATSPSAQKEETPDSFRCYEEVVSGEGYFDHYEQQRQERRTSRALSFASSLSMSSFATESSGFPTPSHAHSQSSYAASTPTRKTYTEVLKGSGPPPVKGPPATARHSDERSWRSDDRSWRSDASASASMHGARTVTNDTENSLGGSSVSGASGMSRAVLISQSGNGKHAAAAGANRTTVHWPHSSFRYMFLAESMKKYIVDTVARIRCLPGGEDVCITCPYRDKKDASACMLLDGKDKEAVRGALRLFDDMLRRVMAFLRAEKLLLSSAQYQQLTSDDLGKVKAIQGSSGVHIM
jgi:hypothetical protein